MEVSATHFPSSWLNKHVPVSRQRLGCGPFHLHQNVVTCFVSVRGTSAFQNVWLVHLWLFFFRSHHEKKHVLFFNWCYCCSSARSHEHLSMPLGAARPTWHLYSKSQGKERGLLILIALRYWEAQSFQLILIADAENLLSTGRYAKTMLAPSQGSAVPLPSLLC